MNVIYRIIKDISSVLKNMLNKITEQQYATSWIDGMKKNSQTYRNNENKQ